MDIKNSFKSPHFGQVMKILGAFVAVLLIFQLGAFVGFRKARFSYNWGDNYHRAFGGPPMGGFMRDFEGRDYFSGHGTVGTVAKIDGDSLVIQGVDGVEKVITVSDKTSIVRGRTNLIILDLKVDDRIVVIGTPKDDGSIEAKIIRVFDNNDFLPSFRPSSSALRPVTNSQPAINELK